jgi:hypothetical protein
VMGGGSRTACACCCVCVCVFWRAAGIELGGCGDRSVRLRPSLVFRPTHATIFLETLDKVMGKKK